MVIVDNIMVPGLSANKLSIYDESKSTTDLPKLDSNSSSNLMVGSKSFGISAMMLVSGIQEKYRNVVSALHNFQTYAKSTEGKIKFSVMFVGFAGGCLLSYRSTSKRMWYRRMLPFGTLSVAASVCYPYSTWEVAKKFSRGIAITYNTSKFVVSYTYGKLKMVSSNKDKSVPVPESNLITETEYTIAEKGILTKTSKPENPLHDDIPSDAKEIPEEKRSGDKTESTLVKYFNESNSKISQEKNCELKEKTVEEAIDTTDLYKFVSVSDTTEQKIINVVPKGDIGQSSAEDASLYTTRS